MEAEYCIALTTISNFEEGKRLSKALLEKRLAACVSLVPISLSIYWWKGKLEESPEVLLIIKTRKELIEELEKVLQELHSYSVPEFLVLDVVQGSEKYLKWLEEETRA